METVSAAGSWLHRALLDLCSNAHPAVIQLDADVVASLVSYCEGAPPDDAKEYLSNMIGEEYCKDIISGYLQRRGTKGAVEEDGGVGSDGMQVYIKPQMNEVWSAGSKKIIKNAKAKMMETNRSLGVAESSNANGLLGPSSKSKTGGGRGKRTVKGVSLADAAEGKIMSRGAPCNCQATRHKLVNNCLTCGRIVCEQEGEGPCNFCGALVLVEGSTYAGLEGSSVPASESEAAAQAFKDRLVEYGRTSSQRTTVIDDQSDYFQVEESTWLSEEEKRIILKRQEEAQMAEEARKKKVVVSIDLIGRKVVMASDTDHDAGISTSILGGNPLEKRSTDVRIKPNPYILTSPVYLKPKEMGHEGGNMDFARRQNGSHRNNAFVKTGRVQHDDPFIAAVGSDTTKADKGGIDNVWKTPNVKGRADMRYYEDEECLTDCQVMETEAISVFDICEHLTGKRISLSPTLLAQKQSQKALKSESSSSFDILMPGMVLLKRWLSQRDQMDIIERCRRLGIGHGGFYQPGYGAESKMHLHMMCLGMHWEPITRSYETKRSIDNTSAPPIPPEFEVLVMQCLEDARRAGNDQNKGQERERGSVEMVPEMRPNVCLINFYDRSGKLGLHQDKDESSESLNRGIPVVSFSIGDSAEFLYGLTRDVDAADKVTLESGDVLVFGGPSRMIYHGVASIVPQTAPSWLIEKTNLRPGRLNLTFRQF